MKFYKCNQCGDVIVSVQDNDPKVTCFGEEMVELVPKTADSAVEKHVPVVEVEGNQVKVTVGSTLHPMAEEHSIQWVALETEQGNQVKYLKPGQEPVAVFALTPGDKVVAAYEYCNLHGLWKA
ncbi:MAG: desulfoferrodoxin [Ruminiclostridium sp.]|nr:desulfoferrodoxin [Ruminiclostridium sp.]